MHRPPKHGDIVQIPRHSPGIVLEHLSDATLALKPLDGSDPVVIFPAPHYRRIRLLGSTAPRSARRKPATVAKVQEPASPVSEPAARSYGASGVDPSSLF